MKKIIVISILFSIIGIFVYVKFNKSHDFLMNRLNIVTLEEEEIYTSNKFLGKFSSNGKPICRIWETSNFPIPLCTTSYELTHCRDKKIFRRKKH